MIILSNWFSQDRSTIRSTRLFAMACAACLPRRLRPKWLRSSLGTPISKGRTALFQQGACAAYGLHYSKPFLYRYLTAPAVIPLKGKFARSRRCARRFWPVEPVTHEVSMVSRRRPVARNWRRHKDLPRSCAMGGSTLPASWAILRESGTCVRAKNYSSSGASGPSRKAPPTLSRAQRRARHLSQNRR